MLQRGATGGARGVRSRCRYGHSCHLALLEGWPLRRACIRSACVDIGLPQVDVVSWVTGRGCAVLGKESVEVGSQAVAEVPYYIIE